MDVREVYLSATAATDLKVHPYPCHADYIIAAGLEAGGDLRKDIAVRLWRMRHSGRYYGFRDLVDDCQEAIGIKHGAHLSPLVQKGITAKTLFWSLDPVCKVCGGLGHPVIPDTPHLNYAVNCPNCLGAGRVPLWKMVWHKHECHAVDLVEELDRCERLVFEGMKRRLWGKG